MAKYQLVREMKFWNDKERKIIVLKKGSIFDEANYKKINYEMSRCLKNAKKKSKNNERFVVLYAEGQDRLFTINKDVTIFRKKRKFLVR